jgi:hypothetical protein
MNRGPSHPYYESAIEIAGIMGIDFPDEVVLGFEEPEHDCIEHVCHELAHAILLGLPLFDGKLSDAIAAELSHLRHPSDFADWNEAMCFVVERQVLKKLDIEVDDLTLRDALEMQVGLNLGAIEAFTSGEDHEETHEAILRIPRIFETYKERS